MTNRVERVLYGAILRAYPAEFRARFGSEMMGVFSEEIREQQRLCGLHGALRACCRTLWEVASVAGPLRLQSSSAQALLISIFASSFMACAFFAAVTTHCGK